MLFASEFLRVVEKRQYDQIHHYHKMADESATTDLIDLIKCSTTLAHDADEAEKLMLESSDEAAKRHFVRAVFAWIEAISFLFRQAALIKMKKEPLTHENCAVMMALEEKAYTINDKGELATAPFRAATSSMMMFSLKRFAVSQGIALDYAKGSKNWQAYVKALKIRDRLTHPKTPSDVNLSQEDIEMVREAKGMVLVFMEVVLNPGLIAVINAHRDIAVNEGREITLTFSEEDLRHFRE